MSSFGASVVVIKANVRRISNYYSSSVPFAKLSNISRNFFLCLLVFRLYPSRLRGEVALSFFFRCRVPPNALPRECDKRIRFHMNTFK